MYPFVPGSTGLPFSSTIAVSMPGTAKVAEPGFIGIVSIHVHILSIIPPVSVCHHVSTIGQLSLPIVLKYQDQTSGFIGSPTVPSSLRDERSNEFGIASPYFMYIRS